MKTIPQRELRNHVSRVLREVEQGERLRITVDGRPVAELVPIVGRRVFVPVVELERILAAASLDEGFAKDVEAVAGGALDEL